MNIFHFSLILVNFLIFDHIFGFVGLTFGVIKSWETDKLTKYFSKLTEKFLEISLETSSTQLSSKLMVVFSFKYVSLGGPKAKPSSPKFIGSFKTIFEVYNILKTSIFWSQKNFFFKIWGSKNWKNKNFELWDKKMIWSQNSYR